MSFFEPQRSALLLIDVQEKLFAGMQNREALLQALCKLVRGAALFDVPIIWFEQNPTKMGATIAPLRELLGQAQPSPKLSFGCCQDPAFARLLESTGRDQLLIAGIEAHVCVAQTALQLLQRGLPVQVLADAVSARHAHDYDIALQRIRDAATRYALGPAVTTTEAILFEWMQSAEHPQFRDVLRIIR